MRECFESLVEQCLAKLSATQDNEFDGQTEFLLNRHHHAAFARADERVAIKPLSGTAWLTSQSG